MVDIPSPLHTPHFLSLRKGRRNSHGTVANILAQCTHRLLCLRCTRLFFPPLLPLSLLFANQSHSGQSLQQAEQHSILALFWHQMKTEELQCPQQNKGDIPFSKHLLLLCCGSGEAKPSTLHWAKVLTESSVAHEATILMQNTGPR